MSQRRKTRGIESHRVQAPIFAALGDETRLSLIGRLSAGKPCSITELSEESSLTRQAITKHLRVLEDAALVASERRGRELLFRFVPARIQEAKTYLEQVSAQWDQTLDRLKTFVETDWRPEND